MQRCDRRLLQCMAGVSHADGSASVEVASRCFVKSLTLMMYETRLRCYGQVKRRTRPIGRPKKTRMKNFEEDM